MQATSESGGGLSPIVKTVARWMAGFILVFGLSVVLYGHLTPGGGFAGGVVLSAAFILVVLSHGRREVLQILSERAPTIYDGLAALAFLLLAVLGYAAGGFFLNFLPKGQPFQLWSGGIIPLCNLAIGVKVGACLFGVFAALAVFRHLHQRSA
ncbi:cation:proton antiporter [bacterium]|nr:cation:proton antiporter [bacterium]